MDTELAKLETIRRLGEMIQKIASGDYEVLTVDEAYGTEAVNVLGSPLPILVPNYRPNTFRLEYRIVPKPPEDSEWFEKVKVFFDDEQVTLDDFLTKEIESELNKE